MIRVRIRIRVTVMLRVRVQDLHPGGDRKQGAAIRVIRAFLSDVVGLYE